MGLLLCLIKNLIQAFSQSVTRLLTPSPQLHDVIYKCPYNLKCIENVCMKVTTFSTWELNFFYCCHPNETDLKYMVFVTHISFNLVMWRHYKQQSRTILIFRWSSFILQISEPASMMTFSQKSQSTSLLSLFNLSLPVEQCD